MKKLLITLAIIGLAVNAYAGNFSNSPNPKLKIPLPGVEKYTWRPVEEEGGDYFTHMQLKKSIPMPTNALPSGIRIATWDVNVNISYDVVASNSEILAKSGTNVNVKIKKVFGDKEDAIGNYLIQELQ